jgi:hypothetical protein
VSHYRFTQHGVTTSPAAAPTPVTTPARLDDTPQAGPEAKEILACAAS